MNEGPFLAGLFLNTLDIHSSTPSLADISEDPGPQHAAEQSVSLHVFLRPLGLVLLSPHLLAGLEGSLKVIEAVVSGSQPQLT